MAFQDFRRFSVWQKAFTLVTDIYKVTKNFPSEEKYGLTSDVRRAANSVAHNIAEGYGRYEPKDKTRFYKISRGSAYEVMSQVMVGEALGFIDANNKEILIQTYKESILELDKLIKSVESRTKK